SLLLLPKEAATTHAGSSGPSRTWSAVREMLSVIQKQPAVSAAVLVYAVLLFVAPSQALLVPIFVTSVLHGGAAQLGFLFAASGIGTVAGSLFVASFGDYRRRGRLLVSANVVWVLALAAFALSRSLAPSLVMWL